MAPNLLVFLILAGLKLLGLGVRPTGLVPRMDRLYEIAWDDLPAEDFEALAGPVAEWEKLGFRRQFTHEITTPQRGRSATLVVLLSPVGDAVAQIAYFVRPDG